MNVVSVSWGDHLSFGEGDGRLDTRDKVARRLRAWRDELGARAVHWRMLRTRIAGAFAAAPGYQHPSVYTTPHGPDPRAQQITRNVLARMLAVTRPATAGIRG